MREINEKQSRVITDDVKEANDEERTVTHWISTESVDRMGDIVRAKGMLDESYEKNPVVLYGHNYAGFPVGKSLWRRYSERGGVKGVLAKTKFADTSEGRQVYELWKGGYLNAASIGFMPKEYEQLKEDDKWTGGYDIKKWELFEYSIVPVPANQDAVRLAIEKGVVDSPMVINPLLVNTYEDRLCDLEKCKGKMEEYPGLLRDIITRLAELEKKDRELEEYTSLVQSDLEDRLSQANKQIEELLTPRTEAVAGIPRDQAQALIRDIVRGAVSQMRGKVV